MRAFGQVLKQQRTILSQHVGLQRQQTVLTHESRAQVGDGGSLQRILLLRRQGLGDVAGFPTDEGFLDGRVGVRSLHSAVRAAGLCYRHISTCVTKDAIRDANKFPRCGTPTTRACLTVGPKRWELITTYFGLAVTQLPPSPFPEAWGAWPFRGSTESAPTPQLGVSVLPASAHLHPSLLPHQRVLTSIPGTKRAERRERDVFDLPHKQ